MHSKPGSWEELRGTEYNLNTLFENLPLEKHGEISLKIVSEDLQRGCLCSFCGDSGRKIEA